jgi:hypothetical protein
VLDRYRGANAVDAALCRPEKTPAGQHEQQQQQITFMPAQVIGENGRIVNDVISSRFKSI